MTLKNLLIVEDDTFLAQAYAMAFASDKVTVTVAKDGLDALEQMHKQVPDAVILDLLLPRLDGFGVLVEMKKNPSLQNVPVIVATNVGQQADVERGKSLGATDYIVKSSTSMADVTAKVRALLGL